MREEKKEKCHKISAYFAVKKFYSIVVAMGKMAKLCVSRLTADKMFFILDGPTNLASLQHLPRETDKVLAHFLLRTCCLPRLPSQNQDNTLQRLRRTMH